jgi:hypothetical protein
LKEGKLALKRDLQVGDGVGVLSGNIISGAVVREITVDGKKVKKASAGDTVDIGLAAKDSDRVYLTSSERIKVHPDFTVERPALKAQPRKAVKVVLPEIKPGKPGPAKLLAKVYSLKEAMEVSQAGADIVFYNIFAADFPESQEWPGPALLGAYLPRILNDDDLEKVLELLMRKRPGAILSGNPGILALAGRPDIPVYLDYDINAFNDIDIDFWGKLGAATVISTELSLSEMGGLANKNVAVLVHGDVALVNTLINPGAAELMDARGETFRVRREGDYWQILNSRPFGVFDDIRQLVKLGFRQFFIDIEGKGAAFVALYKKVLAGGSTGRRQRRGYTSGHLYKPVM